MKDRLEERLSSLVVSTKPIRIEHDSPEGLATESTTLWDFLVKERAKYLDVDRFPLTPRNAWVSEGGCQFAFNRRSDAPIRCCCGLLPNECRCDRSRVFWQEAGELPFVILDIERHAVPNKYSKPSANDLAQIEVFEKGLASIETVLFFYRTKCMGFRVCVSAEYILTTSTDYEECAQNATQSLARIFPRSSTRGEPSLLYVDTGASFDSGVFHGYPRKSAIPWVNPILAPDQKPN